MITWPRECRHHWQINRTNYGVCAVCSAEAQFDPNGKEPPQIRKPGRPVTRAMVNRFYENHGREILADVAALGRNGTENKWHIPKATLSHLVGRWDPAQVKPRRSPHHRRPSVAASSKTAPEAATGANREAPVVVVHRPAPKGCIVCGNDGSGSVLDYIDADGKRLYLCRHCSGGAEALLKALGMNMRVEMVA